MSVLPKIEALIARAVHPETPVEEARTSAVIAVKLIHEHKVKLVENGASQQQHNPFVDIMDIIFRQEQRQRVARCPHGVLLGAGCVQCRRERTAKKKPKSKTRRAKKPAADDFENRGTPCPHGKFWPTCEQCWERDFFGRRDSNAPKRTVYIGTLPTTAFPIRCVCCQKFAYGNEKICWTGSDTVSVYSPIAHERCVGHWRQDTCSTCGKRTT